MNLRRGSPQSQIHRRKLKLALPREALGVAVVVFVPAPVPVRVVRVPAQVVVDKHSVSLDR